MLIIFQLLLLAFNFENLLSNLILPYSYDVSDRYYVAQIIPPAQYRVIIWDEMVGKVASDNICNGQEVFSVLCVSNLKRNKLKFYKEILTKTTENLAKCFVHFYSVDTDEKGQFLLEKNGKVPKKWTQYKSFNGKQFVNFHVIPMKEEVPISDGDSEMFAVQKVYAVNKKLSLDKQICKMSAEGERCLRPLFKKAKKREEFMKNALFDWLAQDFNVSDKENFFLTAFFRSLLDEAKFAKLMGSKMEPLNAELLGIFWNEFTKAQQNEILIRRIRAVDDRMVGMIKEFCEIDQEFLIGHVEMKLQLEEASASAKFCSKLPGILEKSSRFALESVAYGAFRKWLLESSDNFLMDEEETRQIVQFWLYTLGKRIQKFEQFRFDDKNQSVLRQIGDLFMAAKMLNKLTVKRLNQIDGTSVMLGQICENIHNFWLFTGVNVWINKLCQGGKFKPNVERENKSNNNQYRNNYSSGANKFDSYNIVTTTPLELGYQNAKNSLDVLEENDEIRIKLAELIETIWKVIKGGRVTKSEKLKYVLILHQDRYENWMENAKIAYQKIDSGAKFIVIENFVENHVKEAFMKVL